jgi:molybdopterin-guanine dinucleotide biosynthesis protein A
MRSGVILAGGKSTRMGVDKGLIQLGDRPLFSWCYDALSKVVEEVVVSVSAEASSEFLELLSGKSVKIVKDEKSGIGPAEGLIKSFEAASGEYVAVAPCDSPFIKAELYTILFENAVGFSGAVPRIDDYFEPLHAVYNRAAYLNALKKNIGAGNYKINDINSKLNINYISRSDLQKIDPELNSFFNINTNEDFEKALMTLKNSKQ